MITANQLVAHAVGDYILQSDYMAQKKSELWAAAISHVVLYTLPFVLLTQSPAALAFIAVTHLVIDRYRLARYVGWLKNFLAPKWIDTWKEDTFTYHGPVEPRDAARMQHEVIRNYPWDWCKKTGYVGERPEWLTVWLMIITDNVMHVLCNGFAVTYL